MILLSLNFIAEKGKSHFLLTQRKKNKSKSEVEEEKKKEQEFKGEISLLSNKINQLQSKLEDYKEKLAIEAGNSDKLQKLFDDGYIDADGNPLK